MAGPPKHRRNPGWRVNVSKIALFLSVAWFSLSFYSFSQRDVFGQQLLPSTASQPSTTETVLSKKVKEQTVRSLLRKDKNDDGQPSPFAYAFVIGGCHPYVTAYTDYIYDVLNSAYLLWKFGSKADIVLFIQISIKSNATVLPDEEVRWIQDMGIILKYIPKTQNENFYSIQLNKFRILGLTEYRRVLYMDSDTLALTNLDYFFEFSDKGITQPNMILAGAAEPANGGFFMFEPTPTALADVSRIIAKRVEGSKERQKKEGLSRYQVQFDELIGWGHTILPPDKWTANHRSGHNWTFHAPYSDQGLLYYYAKYFRQNMTIVSPHRYENWRTNHTNGEPELYHVEAHPFDFDRDVHFNFSYKALTCNKWTGNQGCPPPYMDFMHFSSINKPWRLGPPEDLNHETSNSTPLHLWWSTLKFLNVELGMGIAQEIANWSTDRPKTIGNLPNVDHTAFTVVDLLEKEDDEPVGIKGYTRDVNQKDETKEPTATKRCGKNVSDLTVVREGYPSEESSNNAIKRNRKSLLDACGETIKTKEQMLDHARRSLALFRYSTSQPAKTPPDNSRSLVRCKRVMLDLGSHDGSLVEKFINAGRSGCRQQFKYPSFALFNASSNRFDQPTLSTGLHTWSKAFRTVMEEFDENAGPEDYCYYGLEGNPAFTERLRTLEDSVLNISPRPLSNIHFLHESIAAEKNGETKLYLDLVNSRVTGSSVFPNHESAVDSNTNETKSVPVMGYSFATLLDKMLSALSPEATEEEKCGGHMIVYADIEGGEFPFLLEDVNGDGIICKYVKMGNKVDFFVTFHKKEITGDHPYLYTRRRIVKVLKQCGVDFRDIWNGKINL